MLSFELAYSNSTTAGYYFSLLSFLAQIHHCHTPGRNNIICERENNSYSTGNTFSQQNIFLASETHAELQRCYLRIHLNLYRGN